MARWTSKIGSTQQPAVAPAQSRSRRRLLGWTAGGGAALVGALLAKGFGPDQARAQTPTPTPAPATTSAQPSFVGSWLISLTQTMDPNADPNERDLVSFTADGIMFASNSPSSPPDPEGGPGATRTYTTLGQGAWTATGPGKLRFKFVNLDTDEQSKLMDLVQITGTATLAADGMTFDGSFQVLVTGPDGAVMFDSQGDAGTVHGVKIVA